MGLEGLVMYKYMLRGKGDKGHIAAEFGSGEGKRKFKHRAIDTRVAPY